MERYRTTIIMLVLLVALGGFAIVLGNNRGTTPTAEPTATPAPYVWQDANQVIAIDAVSGTQRLAMTKDISTTIWTIQEPISDTADPFAVGNFSDQVQNLQSSAVVTDATDLAQFGLDQPEVTLTLAFSDTAGTRRTLQIGDRTLDGSAYYSKTPDKAEVYLVSNTLVEPLRSWFDSPPKVQPTPTPLLPTPGPTEAITGTATITGTVTVTGTLAPSGTTTPSGPGTPAAENDGTPGATPSGTISGVETSTARPPAGANATTPETTPIIPTATPVSGNTPTP